MTALEDAIRSCTRCPLHEQQEGNHPVPLSVGAKYPKRGIAVVCDFPRYYDSKAGKILRGRDGDMFDSLIEKVGLTRDMFLLTSSVRCKPPNNRIDDYPEAVAACSSWTQDEFTSYDPAVVVLMGRVAMRQVFGADATVAGSRGVLAATPAKHPWGQRIYACTYHPAAATFGGQEVADHIVNDLKAAVNAWLVLRSAA